MRVYSDSHKIHISQQSSFILQVCTSLALRGLFRVSILGTGERKRREGSVGMLGK